MNTKKHSFFTPISGCFGTYLYGQCVLGQGLPLPSTWWNLRTPSSGLWA